MWPTHYIPLRERVDGTPPPRIYLTTPPYPLELTESATASAEFTSGKFDIGAQEELESSGSFVGGELVIRLVTAQCGRDELESSGSFVSGAIAVYGYKDGYGNDELESSGSFVSGAVTDPLVVYDNWPLGFSAEDLLSGGSFVSGALA